MAPREAELVAAFVDLASVLAKDGQVVDVLAVLLERAVGLLGANAAAALLMDDDGQLDLVAGTSAEMQRLEALGAQRHEGPCYDAWRSGVALSIGELTSWATRWPHFVPEATQAGCASMLAQPLSLRGRTFGALGVFSNRLHAFHDTDTVVAQGLADIAGLNIYQNRALKAADAEVRRLDEALTNRAVIDQAKSLLAERLQCPPDDAFNLLRGYARSHNQKLRDIAHGYLRGDLTDHTVAREA